MDSGELKPHPIDVLKIPKQPPTLEQMANDRAAADAMPGPLLNAFSEGSIKAAGRLVRKIVAYDYVILKTLNSPLHRMLLELAKPDELREKVDNEPSEEWDLCLQFTIPCKEAANLLAQGAEAFHQASVERISMAWEPSEVELVILAIFEQLKRNAESANRYSAAAKEANEITFFREPTA